MDHELPAVNPPPIPESLASEIGMITDSAPVNTDDTQLPDQSDTQVHEQSGGGNEGDVDDPKSGKRGTRCQYCSEKLESPCWYCVDCPGELFEV